jgi:hypothetical protein
MNSASASVATPHWMTTPLTAALCNTLLLGMCAISVAMSMVESAFNWDMLHWGLMYSSAADFLEGRSAFEQSYEIYGILTTALQAFWLWVFGESLYQLGIGTGVAYAVMLFFHYLLARQFLNPSITLKTERQSWGLLSPGSSSP